MLIRNILFLIILALSPYQAYGMKRAADESLDLAITTKKGCFELSPNQIMFDDIKKSIYNFDANKTGPLICTEHACQLSNEQKNALHMEAKNLKRGIVLMQDIGGGIAAVTDDEIIKNKFSYDDYYKNVQKTSRNLYALKTLPSLVFPQAIFTPAPLCSYDKCIKESDQRTKPDQCLVALMKNEQKAIRLCNFHITCNRIAKYLIKKIKQGISVEIITHREQGNEGNQAIQLLIDNGISVLSPQKHYEQMHHKFCIFDCNIDDKTLLWTGSYNLTEYSNSHSWDDANILDCPGMIKQYNERFEEIKERSNPYKIPAQQPKKIITPPKNWTPSRNSNEPSKKEKDFLNCIDPDKHQ